MLTPKERKERFGIDLQCRNTHRCGVAGNGEKCPYMRECMAEDIHQLDMFLFENPEPLAGEFPLFTAEALCTLLDHNCHACPMLIKDSLARFEDQDEDDEDELGEDEYCAFGFYEGRPDLVDPYEGISRNLDHKPDPDRLEDILHRAQYDA